MYIMPVSEQNRARKFLNKKPSDAQILARIRQIASGKTVKSAEKFAYLQNALQNSPNNTHYKMSQAMFAMENNTPGVYMISQRKMLGNKFNIPKNAVNKYLSKFTPRKKVAAPKTNNRIRKLVKNLANATGVCNNK